MYNCQPSTSLNCLSASICDRFAISSCCLAAIRRFELLALAREPIALGDRSLLFVRAGLSITLVFVTVFSKKGNRSLLMPIRLLRGERRECTLLPRGTGLPGFSGSCSCRHVDVLVDKTGNGVDCSRLGAPCTLDRVLLIASFAGLVFADTDRTFPS